MICIVILKALAYLLYLVLSELSKKKALTIINIRCMELLCKNIFVFKIMIIENDNYFYKV